jgi:hypothetical protein
MSIPAPDAINGVQSAAVAVRHSDTVRALLTLW